MATSASTSSVSAYNVILYQFDKGSPISPPAIAKLSNFFVLYYRLHRGYGNLYTVLAKPNFPQLGLAKFYPAKFFTPTV